jgi:thiosulfate reductase cytochrome b subunit
MGGFMRKLSVLIIFIIILGFFTSCASTKTYKEQFAGINKMIKANDYASAIAKLEAAKGKYYTEKEKVVYYLDLGMLYHYNIQKE